MITPDRIRQIAARAYTARLGGWLAGAPFEPLSQPVGQLPRDYHTLSEGVAALLDGAAPPGGHGYHIEMVERASRTHGHQTLPHRILIPTQADLLALLGKADEWRHFCDDVALIRTHLPALEAWLRANPQAVIAAHGLWPDLLTVCTYLLAHPRPAIHIRELPLPLSTKFIEANRPLLRTLFDALLPPEAIDPTAATFEQRYGFRPPDATVRLRLLDPSLPAHLGWPFDDLSIPRERFAALTLPPLSLLIVENKQTFLSLPPLPDTVALLGAGYGVEQFRSAPWLSAHPIWYWGDLDAHGFDILSRLRAFTPQTRSLLMDEATWARWQHLAGEGAAWSGRPLPHLTPAEASLAAYLARTQRRLEQEHIPYPYAVQVLQDALHPHPPRHV